MIYIYWSCLSFGTADKLFYTLFLSETLIFVIFSAVRHAFDSVFDANSRCKQKEVNNRRL